MRGNFCCRFKFNQNDSATILRYLAQSRHLPDHWYPSDLKKRARVDEILDYNHTSLRKYNTALLSSAVFGRKPEAAINQETYTKLITDLHSSYKYFDGLLKER